MKNIKELNPITDKYLYDTAHRILSDSGILDHFVSWCIGQNIYVLDDDDFIDFLNTESFSYKEKRSFYR